jgi:predicted TIM-barrel fold metal-dependent hydrolase
VTLYDGPILDAHHHLWDLGLGRHPWLAEGEGAIRALGDIAYMRRDYLPADYLADVGAEPVVGTVCVEAAWDRTRPVTEEVDWLASLRRPKGIAARFVAWASLRAADTEAALAMLAERPAVVGLRETVRWHPDPAKSWVADGLMDDAAWRRGVAALGRHGFLLELLMNPYQAPALARLAADLPDQIFVIDHCGSPVDRDPEGLARWREGLSLMARQPNVAIKLSNFMAYAPDHAPAALRRTVSACLDAFGPERCLFGTDYPVARRHMSYAEICGRFREAIAGLSAGEQRAVFHDNAARLYRFGAA